MLQTPAETPPPSDQPPAEASRRQRHAALGPTAVRLCEALRKGNVLAVVCSEQRGEAIAKAVTALSHANVLWCPASDALPGDDAPASPAIAGKRFAALSAVQSKDDAHILLVTDATSAAQKVAPPSAFAGQTRVIRTGEPIDGEALAAALEPIGYFADERVDEPGEMAIRGGTVDLFPADADRPIRIHFSDGRVDRITPYDAVTQLGSDEELDVIEIRPASEPGVEGDAVTIFEHLADAAIALDPEAAERRDSFVELARDAGRGAERSLADLHDWERALAGRERFMLAEGQEKPGRRFVEARNPERAFLAELKAARERQDVVVIAGAARDLRFLSRRIEQRLHETPDAAQSWQDVIAAKPGALLLMAAELERGWNGPGLTVIATSDLLGARAQTAGPALSSNPLAQEVVDFHLGDAVIHEGHGLGVLRGVDTVSTGESESDAIRLEYAGGSQRLVAVDEAHRLWRYGAEADAVTLDKLDGSSWGKRRSAIDEAIAETASQLVSLAEERAGKTAPVLDPPVSDYERFSAGFVFTETPDQLRAIEAVRADLASGKPMDRLVVGDVGYGKTEVALRAAAIAALAGMQVAIVAPTTVLVRQHIETFTKRFARLGIRVAGLSRLSSTAEAREVKKGLTDGSVRIVIGTQAVAGKGVAFKNLALVIIDEEQRFGTATKQKLRDMSDGAHVLTLTATPIPRTLQTALVGLQSLSLITTPPARRLPTRTSVGSFAPERVRPALLREKRRGGQSFVVVPRIEDMEPMAAKLRALVPNLKLRQAHGKMPAAEIDEEMIRFSAGDGDILLATNIIEAGLDIPRANTMIISRADRFGLAQLHQLRGRVGRGRARGYLLLLTEEGAEIAPATMKRLRTMEALDQLGAGFAISARDLDLRGAGDLMGEQQAGHMKLIGLGLYQHLLEQALRAARGETVDDWVPELHLGVSGRFPAEWIPEADVRINLYVRLARVASSGEMDALAEEIEDRFGSLPAEAVAMIDVARIRLLAREAGIDRLDAGPAAIALTPRAGRTIDAEDLETKGERLLLKERTETGRERLTKVTELLERIAPAD